MPQSEKDTLWMAYNHNDTKLMKAPASFEEAKAESEAYSYATGNPSYIDKVE